MEAIKIINLNQQSLPLPESFSNLNIEVMHIKSASVWQTLSKENYLYKYYSFFILYIDCDIWNSFNTQSLHHRYTNTSCMFCLSPPLTHTSLCFVMVFSSKMAEVQSLRDWFWLTKKTADCCLEILCVWGKGTTKGCVYKPAHMQTMPQISAHRRC